MNIEYLNLSIQRKLKREKLVWKGSYRIFCISMQRTGTTSVEDFFEHFGYPVARWEDSWYNQWSKLWYDGNYESIFNTNDFKISQVFEDDPWWLPEFYKFLYHRFPESKFILFTRDSDSWFNSMVSHSKGKILGNTWQHCKIYRGEKEFYSILDNDANFKPSKVYLDSLLPIVGHEKHYKDIYEVRNREIIDFFNENDSSRIIHCDLKDPDKWKKLGCFFEIDVPKDFTVHSNKIIK